MLGVAISLLNRPFFKSGERIEYALVAYTRLVNKGLKENPIEVLSLMGLFVRGFSLSRLDVIVSYTFHQRIYFSIIFQ